jgi:hypothetical protein
MNFTTFSAVPIKLEVFNKCSYNSFLHSSSQMLERPQCMNNKPELKKNWKLLNTITKRIDVQGVKNQVDCVGMSAKSA